MDKVRREVAEDMAVWYCLHYPHVDRIDDLVKFFLMGYDFLQFERDKKNGKVELSFMESHTFNSDFKGLVELERKRTRNNDVTKVC